MTREEIEKWMDELARKYVETRDPEIIEEISSLRRWRSSDGLASLSFLKTLNVE